MQTHSVLDEEEGENEVSVIAEWYANQKIFITGPTGFMGKILVEKLLRCCPGVDTIYLLIRSKKGKDPKQRLEEFLECPVFDTIRKQKDGPEIFKKLRCVNGDVTKKDCGISEADLILLKDEVSTVFHMAANVRFDQSLKHEVLLNCTGTLNVLELLCDFRKLKAFVHVSTTYCHCDQLELQEKLYRSPHSPRDILEIVKWMDDDVLETLTPKLLKNSPNTYAYTKCLSEELVSEYSDRLPIAIVRPSIVTASLKEPIPGWVDNLNGPTGILIGAGKGIIRTMLCNGDFDADIVPVDMGINSMLIVAWKLGSQAKRDEVDVYNISCDKDNCSSWGEALEVGRKYVLQYPFSVCLWYPGGSIKTNQLAHTIAAFFFHLVPAYFIDFLLILTRNKPFLVRIQRRVQNGLKMLQYYTMRRWVFHNNKLKIISAGLSQADRRLFYTDWGLIKIDEYMLNFILGARKYCMHEELDTLPRARKIMKRLYYMDLVKNVILTVLALWLFFHFAGQLLNFFDHPFQFLGGPFLRPELMTIQNI